MDGLKQVINPDTSIGAVVVVYPSRYAKRIQNMFSYRALKSDISWKSTIEFWGIVLSEIYRKSNTKLQTVMGKIPGRFSSVRLN